MKLPVMFGPKSGDIEVERNPLIQDEILKIKIEKEEGQEAQLHEDRRRSTILSRLESKAEVNEEADLGNAPLRTWKERLLLHIPITAAATRDEAGLGAARLKVR